MASATPARRVLGDLNANTPLKSRAGGSSQSGSAKASNSPTKPRIMGETSISSSHTQTTMLEATGEEAQVLGIKRSRDDANDEDESSAPLVGTGGRAVSKRHKVSHSSNLGTPAHTSVDILCGAVRGVPQWSPVAGQEEVVGRYEDDLSGPPSPESVASPASSFRSQDNEMNDSQNTTITIPDDDLLPPRALPLSHEQLRQKAKEIKLRLRLASYKVRTNQIDIPISRLEVRSSGASISTTSKAPSSAITQPTKPSSQSQPVSRPSTAPTVPDISLQTPSAENKRPKAVAIPSSPPAHHSTQNPPDKQTSSKNAPASVTREFIATPVIPRQRESLLNPPALGTPTKGGDLASSMLKGRAADGLLSLMRHQN
ncbi:hypothetical protein MBM_09925 [Drepanopeziza brunnea f. sp. 'multigermtubi' MB_m1]|uniref:Cyclin-dependent kinase n=1 Tax=Marssonina brunnea f. sp. multigermtubi (strain MB_m1) TaxID=1072389 RepID=K1WI71_MARBU|nr:uncharacterized protein MBM_09925 [Drepanopeziza brunnea f. sp. 'multigermtubi' MB_m1]EKD11902.1 hypothetical protein MBM_09925 [Drepanopeziza brunnea f. sp. 'multigermtubi' MB_m1]